MYIGNFSTKLPSVIQGGTKIGWGGSKESSICSKRQQLGKSCCRVMLERGGKLLSGNGGWKGAKNGHAQSAKNACAESCSSGKLLSSDGVEWGLEAYIFKVLTTCQVTPVLVLEC